MPESNFDPIVSMLHYKDQGRMVQTNDFVAKRKKKQYCAQDSQNKPSKNKIALPPTS